MTILQLLPAPSRPQRTVLRIGLWIPVLLSWLGLISADAAGVGQVTATRDSIRVQLERMSAFDSRPQPTAVAEVAPCLAPVSSNLVVVAALPGGRDAVIIPRFDGDRDRLYSGFVAVHSNASGVFPLGQSRYAERFDGVAKFTPPFPGAAGKKGLQVQMLDDAIKLGIKHASLNVNLTGLIDLDGRPGGLSWLVDGRPVMFRAGAIQSLDQQVRTLTDAGVVVSLILLTYASGQPKVDGVMLHPGYDLKAPNHLGAFNAETVEGVRALRASVEFLAYRYSDPAVYGGRVANYILGNEVNSHWFWSNLGRVPMETFAESYLRAARVAHTALRTASSSARLYLSLEHHWSIRYPGGDAQQAFPGRPFLEYFNRRAKEQGDFDWHLAFHPYPENLFEPRTWNDRSATPTDDTPRITFKNLPVLMRFLERPELRWQGQSRRVILSEQGFHTVDGPNGELWQAAAYAYAWEQVDRLPGIDAFILHRHVDHGHEGGLRLGLWTRDEKASGPSVPAKPKRIYDLFRAAGTPDWNRAAAFALPVIGIQRWEALADGKQGKAL